MNRITEHEIEEFALQLLEDAGYQYLDPTDIAPGGQEEERVSHQQVLFLDRLQQAIARINPTIPPDVQQEALKQVLRHNSPELIANNETFHQMLTEGISVSYQKDGNLRGDLVWLIDFDNPDNNQFTVTNQFTVIENSERRPDVVVFVNGLPLVVMELKNPADENATIRSAYNQLQTYKQEIPALFNYNGLLVISDGLEAKVGSLSAGFSRFMAWKTSDGQTEASAQVAQMETLVKGMLNPRTLLDLIRHFIVFQKGKQEDRETGQITVKTTKILAAYHQYYAVNRAVESALRAAGYAESKMMAESPASYGLQSVDSQPVGDRKAGVIWHTQGSGKSLSMVFFTGKIVQIMDNPTIVMITDRNDLDDQLFDTFASSRQLLRQEPVQAEDRQHIIQLLSVASGGIVFTTIHKFQPEEGNVYQTLSDRKNIIVIADEAHRTQYGFEAKTIDEKDKDGKVIGTKTVYGFAKYMRDALPEATYLGFTGTPIEGTDIILPLFSVTMWTSTTLHNRLKTVPRLGFSMKADWRKSS